MKTLLIALFIIAAILLISCETPLTKVSVKPSPTQTPTPTIKPTIAPTPTPAPTIPETYTQTTNETVSIPDINSSYVCTLYKKGEYDSFSGTITNTMQMLIPIYRNKSIYAAINIMIMKTIDANKKIIYGMGLMIRGKSYIALSSYDTIQFKTNLNQILSFDETSNFKTGLDYNSVFVLSKMDFYSIYNINYNCLTRVNTTNDTIDFSMPKEFFYYLRKL